MLVLNCESIELGWCCAAYTIRSFVFLFFNIIMLDYKQCISFQYYLKIVNVVYLFVSSILAQLVDITGIAIYGCEMSCDKSSSHQHDNTTYEIQYMRYCRIIELKGCGQYYKAKVLLCTEGIKVRGTSDTLRARYYYD